MPPILYFFNSVSLSVFSMYSLATSLFVFDCCFFTSFAINGFVSTVKERTAKTEKSNEGRLQTIAVALFYTDF